MSAPAPDGSACVVWHKDADGIVHVLMGVESRYLTDYIETLSYRELNMLLRGDDDTEKPMDAVSARTDELRLNETPGCCERDARNRKTFKASIKLKEFEKIPVTSCSLERSKPIFERRAKALQGLIGRRVQYDTPVSDAVNHTVHFRIVVDETTLRSLRSHSDMNSGFTLGECSNVCVSSFGILKGRMNAEETPKAAMFRELAEESGTRIGASVALTPIGIVRRNHCFALELNGSQMETWKRHIDSRLARNSGELFNVGWVPCFDAEMNFMRALRPLDLGTPVHDTIVMNGLSRQALELFRDAFMHGKIHNCMPPPSHGPPRPSQDGRSSQGGRSSQDGRSSHSRGINKPHREHHRRPHRGRGGKTRKTNKKTFKRTFKRRK